MYYLDKYGWPIEMIEGRPVLNFFRRLIHTRKIVKHWSHSTDSVNCEQSKPLEVQGKTTKSYRNPEGPEAAARIKELEDAIEEQNYAISMRDDRIEELEAEVERLRAVLQYEAQMWLKVREALAAVQDSPGG
jgi:TolA-binding protein